MRSKSIPALIKAGVLAGLVVAILLSTPPSPAAVAGPPPDPIAVARTHLQTWLRAQGAEADASDFALLGERKSLAGRHVHFQQTINGLPLFGAYVTVNLGTTGNNATLVTGDVAPDIRSSAGLASVTASQAIAIARSAVAAPANFRGSATATAVYFPTDEERAARSWQVRLQSFEPLGDWLVIVSATDGTVLEIDDLVIADHAGASGQVFDPNPVVSSGATIPPPSDCDSPANEAQLTGQYFNRLLPGINAGQGQLVGQYVDLTAPGIPGYKPAGQANEPSHVYLYPCNDDRFEEVMVYYHVDKVQRLVQTLGFTGASAILQSPLPAHAHQFVGCNAYYIYTGIIFGDGCKIGTFQVPVDLAEDADIIVHEYGHALQDDQIAGGYLGTPEGRAMAEGFSDFLAAAVHEDPCMFEWIVSVAYPGLPCLRNLENNSHYPEDINPDEHITGLIWGGALWDLVQTLGDDQAARMKVLTLVLESHFYLNPTAEFAAGAAALRQADIALYGGADLDVIATTLFLRGIPLDSDDDSCHDGAEIQVAAGSEASGGLRNAKNFWDFFDTHTENGLNAGAHLAGAVSVSDIVNVVMHFGQMGSTGIDPLSNASAAGSYHTRFDRTLLGPNPWNLGPPNGSVTIEDIIFAVNQFGHSCL